MPKYLLKLRLNADGMKGTMADGGTGRRAALQQAMETAGGSLEAFYYAFGEVDSYVIVDLPSHAHAVASVAQAMTSGAGRVETVVLLEPEIVDEAAEIQTGYRPPGG